MSLLGLGQGPGGCGVQGPPHRPVQATCTRVPFKTLNPYLNPRAPGPCCASLAPHCTLHQLWQRAGTDCSYPVRPRGVNLSIVANPCHAAAGHMAMLWPLGCRGFTVWPLVLECYS